MRDVPIAKGLPVIALLLWVLLVVGCQQANTEGAQGAATRSPLPDTPAPAPTADLSRDPRHLLNGVQGFGGVDGATCEWPAISEEESVVPAPIFDKGRVEKIEITFHWEGLSDYSPVDSHTTLRKAGDGFDFAVERSAGPAELATSLRDNQSGSVAEADVDRFLTELAAIPLIAHHADADQPFAYEPCAPMLDNYPKVEVELWLADQRLLFFSESQGVDAVPFLVVRNNHLYVANSPAFARALADLNEVLGSDPLFLEPIAP